jgi:transposase
LSA